MSQPKTSLPFTHHDSKAPIPMPQSLSRCKKDEDSPEALPGGSMVSDEIGSDKTRKTMIKSRLHPSTTQEKYYYQMERLRATKRKSQYPSAWVN